jgi:hypothetical protein
VVAFAMYVGGRVLWVESRREPKLEVELKGLNLRNDMVGEGQVRGRLKRPGCALECHRA